MFWPYCKYTADTPWPMACGLEAPGGGWSPSGGRRETGTSWPPHAHTSHRQTGDKGWPILGGGNGGRRPSRLSCAGNQDKFFYSFDGVRIGKSADGTNHNLDGMDQLKLVLHPPQFHLVKVELTWPNCALQVLLVLVENKKADYGSCGRFVWVNLGACRPAGR